MILLVLSICSFVFPSYLFQWAGDFHCALRMKKLYDLLNQKVKKKAQTVILYSVPLFDYFKFYFFSTEELRSHIFICQQVLFFS